MKGIEISMVQAFHSSNRGAPTGFIIKAEEKNYLSCWRQRTIRGHETYGRNIFHPDVALIPIGDYYTMGPWEAAEAVRLTKPSMTIPMHYGTFPILTSSAKDFIEVVGEKVPEVKIVCIKAS